MSLIRRLLLLTSFTFSLFAQAPTISGITVDSVHLTTARVNWTASYYHDTGTDTTLTTGFTSTQDLTGETRQITVGATSQFTAATAAGPATAFTLGGNEWYQVASVDDSTHITVYAHYDPGTGNGGYSENFYEARSGLSCSVISAVATCTLPYPSATYWTTGHKVRLAWTRPTSNGQISDSTYTITTRTDSTHIVFSVTCVGGGTTCDGVHSAATGDTDLRLFDNGGQTHNAGETLSLVSTDAVVCYGNPGGSAGTYPNSQSQISIIGSPRQVQQNSKHAVYLGGLTPGSTIHYVVMSTPVQFGPSNCASPGTHTGVSSDSTITLPASETTDPLPPTGVSFSTALPGSYVSSVTVGGACATIQACYDNAATAVTSGAYEIKITKNTNITLSTPVTLNPITGGATTIVIRSSTSDAAIPAQGDCKPPLVPNTTSPCIDNATYATELATITAPPGVNNGHSHGNDAQPIFQIASAKGISNVHIGPGLKLVANTANSTQNPTAFIHLAQLFGAGVYDHTTHPSNIIIDRNVFYQKNIGNGMWSCLYTNGGSSLAFIDNVVTGIAERAIWGTQDVGCILLQSVDTSDGGIIIKNNRIESAFNTIYASGDGYNTGPALVQQNWLHQSDKWNQNFPAFMQQASYPVSSLGTGTTTTVNLSEPSELGDIGDYALYTYVMFSGATNAGTWDKINFRTYSISAGTLTSINCGSGICTATFPSAHGFTTGDNIWTSGFRLPCNSDVGGRPVTVTSSTTLTYTSSMNGFCNDFDATIIGPVFLADDAHNGGSAKDSSFNIAFNSTGFPALTGTVTMYYGVHSRIGEGGPVNTKNLFELKSADKWEISGNIFEGASTKEQNASALTITAKVAGGKQDVANIFNPMATVANIYVHDNWIKNVGQFLGLQGIHDVSSNQMMHNIKISKNLVSYSSDTRCTPGENCNLQAFGITWIEHFKYLHNTVMTPYGNSIVGANSPPVFGNFTYKDNITPFRDISGTGRGMESTDANNVIHIMSRLYQTSGTCQAGPCALANAPFTENVWSWDKNIWIGARLDAGQSDDYDFMRQHVGGYTAGSQAEYKKNFWPSGIGGVGFNGIYAISAATNASPIVLTVATMSCVPNTGDRYLVQGVRGNFGANGPWTVKNATATSLTLVASNGNGAYTSGGYVIPQTGKCDVIGNWALGSSSNYKAGTVFAAADDPYCNSSGLAGCTTVDSGTSPGAGQSTDSKDIGADITSITNAIGTGSGPPAPTLTLNTVMGTKVVVSRKVVIR